MEKTMSIQDVHAYIVEIQEELKCAARNMMEVPVRLNRRALKKLSPEDIATLEKLIRDDRSTGFPKIKNRLIKLSYALGELDQGNPEPAIAILREELREHARTLSYWDVELGVTNEEEEKLYQVSLRAYKKIDGLIKSVEQPKIPRLH